jgi:alkylhydroperoxidase/carboxymuconolactone decarboxylase family protein YurZ
MENSERYNRGAATSKALFGDDYPIKEGGLKNADFKRMAVEHLMGDVWARPGLSLRDRALITVAVNTALGREREIMIHLYGALHSGVSREEVSEMMLHIAHYAGYPAGAMGMHIAEGVFEDLDRKRAGKDGK